MCRESIGTKKWIKRSPSRYLGIEDKARGPAIYRAHELLTKLVSEQMREGYNRMQLHNVESHNPVKRNLTPWRKVSPAFHLPAHRRVPGNLVSTSQLIGILQLQAPKVNLPTFNDDPMKFFPFIRTFEDNIGRTLLDNSPHLDRLVQLCTGQCS